MKITSKLLTAGLSAVMLLSALPLSAGAVCAADCNNIRVITASAGCNAGECKNIQELVSGLCADGSCCNTDIISFLPNGKECVGEGCSTADPQTITDILKNDQKDQQQSTSVPGEIKDNAPAEVKPDKPDDKTASEIGFNAAYEDEVIRLVNAERAKYGLSALQKDEGAAAAAHIRAKEIVQSFSHTRPDGSSCFTAAKEAGVTYKTAGENIASGYSDPQQVVNGWMNSEGHRKNILSASFTKIGTGCYSSGGVLYWTQFFIG